MVADISLEILIFSVPIRNNKVIAETCTLLERREYVQYISKVSTRRRRDLHFPRGECSQYVIEEENAGEGLSNFRELRHASYLSDKLDVVVFRRSDKNIWTTIRLPSNVPVRRWLCGETRAQKVVDVNVD